MPCAMPPCAVPGELGAVGGGLANSVPAAGAGYGERAELPPAASEPRRVNPEHQPGEWRRAQPRDWPGDDLDGRYETQQVLGEGVYSVVYKAWDREIGQHVVLKKLRFNDNFNEGIPTHVIREVTLLR